MGRKLSEDLKDSCRAIAAFISKEKDNNVRELMLKDFLSKTSSRRLISHKLRPDSYLSSLVKVLSDFFPDDIKKVISNEISNPDFQDEEKSLPVAKKEIFDVAIVTVIPQEFHAASLAFNINVHKALNNIGGQRFFKGKLQRKQFRGKKSLSVLLTMVGEPLNVPCALACEKMFQAYDVQLCILVGIAAGLKEKVKICDTVFAKMVIDYEHQRLESGGKKRKRPFSIPVDNDISRDIQFFDSRKWGVLFQRYCKKIEKSIVTKSKVCEKLLSFKQGVILSGEKLRADGSLPQLKREYHDQVLAVEEEGGGFCRACTNRKIPWLIFRGISDYGEANKSKKWQTVAALSAATAAVNFLKTNYTTKFERKF